MRWLLLLALVAYATGDWILVARLEQNSISRRRKVGTLSPAVCTTCMGKLADTTINNLMGNGVVKLELVRQSTLDCRLLPSVIYFNIGIGNFDSLARRPPTPFSFSESEALAGNFSLPSSIVPPSPTDYSVDLNLTSSSLSNNSSDNNNINSSNNKNINNGSTNDVGNVSSNSSSSSSSPYTVCNFGIDFGPVSAAYAWVVNDNCTNTNVCVDLMLVYVWLPSGPTPESPVVNPGPTAVNSTAVAVFLVPYHDLLLYGGIVIAVLVVCCALLCVFYHHRKYMHKKAKKQAKHEERASIIELQRSSFNPAETTSRSGPTSQLTSQPTSQRNSMHAEIVPPVGITGVPLPEDVLIAYPMAIPLSPPYTTSTSGRTPPYTKTTFPSASTKTILPLTPIKLPETPRHTRTASSPRSIFSMETPDQKAPCSPFRFAFRSLGRRKGSPQHVRSNSSPEILSRLTPSNVSTPVMRRGSTSSPMAASPVFSSGSSPYFVVRMLGRGHFGTAYLVTDTVNHYVLKTQTRSEDKKNDALKEALSLASFPPSPHLLAFRDFFFEGSVFCIVVNYCSGGSLQDQIANHLPPHEVFRILTEISAGLAIIHSKGFIHRDIKPDNLFFANAEERTVVIGDMGLARRVGSDGYYANSFGHTLYKAPEISVQFGKWSKRSDMWAVGCVGLDLLGGESMEQRCQGQNMILGMKTDVEITGIIEVTVGDLVGHPVTKLIQALLRVNPYQRLSAEQVLEYKTALEADPNAVPPLNPTHARVKSSPLPSFVCSELPTLTETTEIRYEVFPDALAPELERHRSPSSLPTSPVLLPSQPPSPMRSKRFSFSNVRKETSILRAEDNPDASLLRSRKADDEAPEEFSPLMTPVVFYSAE